MSERFIGIDVSKDRLDIASFPDHSRWSCPNSEQAMADLVKRLTEASLIVLEATGGLETLVVAALGQAKLPVVVINPRQARDFAKATGKLAKTDAIDAAVLAHFGQAIRPEPRPLKDQELCELTSLLTRRNQLVDMLAAEKNRLSSAPVRIRQSIQEHIRWLEKRIKESNGSLEIFIHQSPLWREKDQLLQSTPGVGPLLSAALITGLPELGTLGPKKIAALVGVAPLNRDSGHSRGKRIVWGGRASLRSALYMGTLAAIRFNPAIKAFYERLVAAGKMRKVAITACMHKLLTILNAIIKNKTPWTPQGAQKQTN